MANQNSLVAYINRSITAMKGLDKKTITVKQAKDLVQAFIIKGKHLPLEVKESANVVFKPIVGKWTNKKPDSKVRTAILIEMCEALLVVKGIDIEPVVNTPTPATSTNTGDYVSGKVTTTIEFTVDGINYRIVNAYLSKNRKWLSYNVGVIGASGKVHESYERSIGNKKRGWGQYWLERQIGDDSRRTSFSDDLYENALVAALKTNETIAAFMG